MKAKFSLLILLFCSVTMTAETYSIVFKSGNGSSDSGTKVNELTKIILSATDNCVESVVTANNIYNAGSGKGIKGGTSSAKGELTIRLNTAYAISTMTVYAASYPHKNDTASGKGISVCGKDLIWEPNHKAELYSYTIQIDSTLSDISIAAKVASNNRWYVQKIEFEAPDPQPNTAVFEMPYMLDFGSVPVEAGEVSEDVVSINVLGKHVVDVVHVLLELDTTRADRREVVVHGLGDIALELASATHPDLLGNLFRIATRADARRGKKSAYSRTVFGVEGDVALGVGARLANELGRLLLGHGD